MLTVLPRGLRAPLSAEDRQQGNHQNEKTVRPDVQLPLVSGYFAVAFDVRFYFGLDAALFSCAAAKASSPYLSQRASASAGIGSGSSILSERRIPFEDSYSSTTTRSEGSRPSTRWMPLAFPGWGASWSSDLANPSRGDIWFDEDSPLLKQPLRDIATFLVALTPLP